MRTNAVIALRPVLSHTRKSLIEARQAWVAQENGEAAAAAIAEEERYDDGVPFVRDVVFTPPEKMKEGTQLAKKLVSWMEDEGAVGIDYVPGGAGDHGEGAARSGAGVAHLRGRWGWT